MINLERELPLPIRHQEIINALVSGESLETLVSVPEGSYVKVKEEAYAGNFITCPAVVIEKSGDSTDCLHVTFNELIEALKNGSFKSNVDFKAFITDITSAKKVSILLSEQLSTGEARHKELQNLKLELLKVMGNAESKIAFRTVPGSQFQLVINNEAVSIWNGTKLIDLL